MAGEEVTIRIGNTDYRLSASRPFVRYEGNPVLTSSRVNEIWTEPHLKVVTVHNAGVVTHNNETLMLFRSHLRNGISVIGKATSQDGLTGWLVDSRPAIKPCGDSDILAVSGALDKQIEMEGGGVEDPRIIRIGDRYYITYSAYHGMIQDEVRVCLASTGDFVTYVRYGPMLNRDMRNVVIFPEKIGKFYYALMRPNDNPLTGHTGGIFKEIRLARTESLESNVWEIFDEPVMKQGGGPSPFQQKIGPGAPPIKTRHGWLSIFHGVRSTMDGNPYVLGVALHDLNDPSKVKVSSIPLVFPVKDDCKIGSDEYVHVPQVVFTCGAIRNDNGLIWIYYGGNDTVMNVGFSYEDILAEMCLEYPQDPLTGKPLYKI
jgi:predicted GH43/DUF377 family glycosyl hydrolase